MGFEKNPSIVFTPAEVLHDYKNPSIFTEGKTPGLNPSNKKSQIRIFLEKSENFDQPIFLKISPKIGPNFLVQLAGQINNKIQGF